MFTRNVWFTRLFWLFHRSTQPFTVGGGGWGAVPCCVVLVGVVLVGDAVVAAVVTAEPVPAWVVVEFVGPTVALVFWLSLPRKISSAARKPTAIASTAMIQVLAPRRSIAAAR